MGDSGWKQGWSEELCRATSASLSTLVDDDYESFVDVLAFWEVFRLLMKTDVLMSSCVKAFSGTRACTTGTDVEFDSLLERGVAKGKSLFKDVYLLSQLLNHYVNPHKRLCGGLPATVASKHVAGSTPISEPGCANGTTNGTICNGKHVKHDCNDGKPNRQMAPTVDTNMRNDTVSKCSSDNMATQYIQTMSESRPSEGLTMLSKLLIGHGTCSKPCMMPLYSRVPFLSLGNFLLFYRINEGSSGKVHVGFHKMHRRTYALKVISKAQLSGERALFKRLKDEMSLSTALSHPNIVRTFELLETHSTLIIAMEYCDGGDLIGIIKEYSPMNEQMARTIFRMVVNGIHYLHLSNICHRDIKPENIFLKRVSVRTNSEGTTTTTTTTTPITNDNHRGSAPPATTVSTNGNSPTDTKGETHIENGLFKSIHQAILGVTAEGTSDSSIRSPTMSRLRISEPELPQNNTMSYTVKIGDFGAATRITGDRSLLDTVGTMSYAAPEVLGCGGIVGYCGKQADVWSLGVLLYAMLFGELPWLIEKVSLREAVQSIVGQTLCFPTDISRSAMNLLHGMLHINPSKRMTIEEVLAHPWFMEGPFDGTLTVKKIRPALSKPL